MWRLLACRSVLVLLTVTVARVSAASAPACGGAGIGTPRGAITSRNAARFSQDATILAARVAPGPWVHTRQAARFESDLRRIRARFPAVTDIHARRDFVLDELLIELDAGAPWLPQWASGQIQTRDVSVDHLLCRFQAAAVDYIATFEGAVVFVVRFGEPLNVPALVERVRSLSPYFRSVEQNGIIGDGDRITFQKALGRRMYTFSLGWGDCAAGCGSRHFWRFILSPDGGMALREYGTPLPSALEGRAPGR